MALIDEEVVAAVAATAAAMSPRARRVARKGLVYGLAGALKAGDVAVAAARGAARATQPGARATDAGAPSATAPARARSGGNEAGS